MKTSGVALDVRIQPEKNAAQAANWVGLAATTGDAAAMLTLGEFFWSGFGLEQDRTKAFLLFKNAGEQGYSPAMLHLGKLILRENPNLDGQATNAEANAYVWLSLADRFAATTGERSEAKILTDQLRPLLAQETLDEAQAVIEAWRPKPPIQLIKPATP